MSMLDRFRDAAERFGYNEPAEYSRRGWFASHLIFLGCPDGIVIFTPKDHTAANYGYGTVYINIRQKWPSYNEYYWSVSDKDAEYILAAPNREDFEARLEAYVTIHIALRQEINS